MIRRDWLLVSTADFPTGNGILEVVCAYCDVSEDDLLGPRVARQVSWPRQLAMWLCRKLLGWSYPRIARLLGRADHVTAMKGCANAEYRLRGRDPHEVWTELCAARAS